MAAKGKVMAEQRRAHGGLKARIVELLWHNDVGLTAKEIQVRFGDDGQVPALSTILTVLERMRKSGDVVRVLGDAGEYLYSPTPAEADQAVESMLGVLMQSSDRTDVLLGFAGSLDANDLETLRKAIGSDGSAD